MRVHTIQQAVSLILNHAQSASILGSLPLQWPARYKAIVDAFRLTLQTFVNVECTKIKTAFFTANTDREKIITSLNDFEWSIMLSISDAEQAPRSRRRSSASVAPVGLSSRHSESTAGADPARPAGTAREYLRGRRAAAAGGDRGPALE